MKENGTGATEKQHLVDIDSCGRYVAGRMGFNPKSAEDVMGYLADFADKHTVDAVEVVRCKDCKKWEYDENLSGWCIEWRRRTLGNHFCSYGERKHNE